MSHNNTYPFSLRRGKERYKDPKYFVTSVCLLRQLLRLFRIPDFGSSYQLEFPFTRGRHSSNDAQYSRNKDAHFPILWQKLRFLSDSPLQLSRRGHALLLKTRWQRNI
jgi:hypothetical protein